MLLNENTWSVSRIKILHLDIETAPSLAHVWGIWQQNVALNQLIVPGYLLSWAAKWDGEREVHFMRVRHEDGIVVPESRRAMLRGIHDLLCQADAVVTYNGASFDLPTLNSEFAQEGMTPPPTVPNIDLMLAVKKRFRFPSYKLAYVSKALGVGSKVKHEGHALWVACMNEDPRAWERMARYNKGDVRLQERLYQRILGWIPNHPNRALWAREGTRPMCPNCGGKRLRSDGLRRTTAQVYRRFVCLDCGARCRGTVKEGAPVERRSA